MAEAILKFKLPEEENEFKLAQRGGDYFSFLWDLTEQLRRWQRGKEVCPYKKVEDLIVWLLEELEELEIWDIE